eukprot:366430-Chlamydomonas_euryale.AAC.22
MGARWWRPHAAATRTLCSCCLVGRATRRVPTAAAARRCLQRRPAGTSAQSSRCCALNATRRAPMPATGRPWWRRRAGAITQQCTCCWRGHITRHALTARVAQRSSLLRATRTARNC